jgi:hypothetical protein
MSSSPQNFFSRTSAPFNKWKVFQPLELPIAYPPLTPSIGFSSRELVLQSLTLNGILLVFRGMREVSVSFGLFVHPVYKCV